MAKLVYGLNQSLDGYVDHRELGPGSPELFPHFIEHVRGVTGMLYDRGMYEVMRYWDEDHPDDDAVNLEFAAVWEQAEVGCVALVEVGRVQRHACRRRH
jgi:hypothetical protein